MSAVQPPPAPPTSPHQLNPLQQHKKRYPHGSPSGPMRGLPSIPKLTTQLEAEQKRNDGFVFPDMISGEPVFYRRDAKGGNHEDIGWYQKEINRVATLTVARPGYTMEEKANVSYWDHTEDDPSLTGDPKAPHNNNGTFRRTAFGKLMSQFLKGDGAGVSKAELTKAMADLQLFVSGVEKSCREEIAALRQTMTEQAAQIAALLDSNKPSVNDGTSRRK